MWRERSDISAGELGLSAPQAAQALGVSVATIRRWSDLGYLESYQTASGRRCFNPERIDSFIGMLEQRQVDPQVDRRLG
jgi:predicted site-specific integrase-resolvase